MAEGEEAERPDEVDLLPGVEARVRLQKFRWLGGRAGGGSLLGWGCRRHRDHWVTAQCVTPATAVAVLFRGLKSFRSSPWDAKEWLPLEYSRVFAFQNLQRAQKCASRTGL